MTTDQMATLEEVVRDVLVDTLGVEPEKFSLDADLERDLGLDSLDRVDLLVAMETHVGSGLSDEELLSIKTARDAIVLVEHKMASE